MIFTAQADLWIVLNQEERKWFARLIIEALFWVHGADQSALFRKYLTIEAMEAKEDYEVFQDTGIKIFDKLSLSDRDAVLWHCLKCACYSNVKINSAVLEGALAAIVRILYWKIKEEIDTGSDMWRDIEEENRPGFIYNYSRYRTLCENIYRFWHYSDFQQQLSDTHRLAPKVMLNLLNKIGGAVHLNNSIIRVQEVQNETIQLAIFNMFNEYEIEKKAQFVEVPYYRKLYRKLYPISSPDAQSLFEKVSENYWLDRIAGIEFAFTPGDNDYSMTQEQARDRGYKPSYYNPNQTLARIRKNKGYAYWDLLFACLREQPIPSYFKLSPTEYRKSWFETIEQTVSPENLSWLQNNIITSEYTIGCDSLQGLN